MFLFRIYCLICGEKTVSLICEKCLNEIVVLSSSPDRICRKCSKPLKDYEICCCDFCKSKNWVFENNFSIFSYNNVVIRRLTELFKFENSKKAGLILANLLEKEIKNFLSDKNFDIITCVPESKISIKERGFAPVEFIIKRLGITYTKLLERKSHIKKQSELSLEEREEFVKSQFYLIKNDTIKDKNILVIDDIFTSGNTLNYISKLLKENGAKKIYTLTFFRD